MSNADDMYQKVREIQELEEKNRTLENKVENFTRVVKAYIDSDDPLYKSMGLRAMRELIGRE